MKLEDIISTIGTSDIRTRIEVMSSSGMGKQEATDTVAMQMIEEIHRGVRGLLLMYGKETGETSESEAIHSKR